MSGTNLALQTSDGVTLRYDDEGHGRPVVFSSGFQGQGAHFVWQRDALVEAGYRVIRYDHRCHGRSDFPQHGQRISRLAEDLGELLTALDLHDVVLVGHSMGVNVSLAHFSLAANPWDRITAFVAVDQSPKIVNDEEWEWGIRGIDEHNVFDAARFKFEWFNTGLEPAYPDHVQQLLDSIQPSWENFPVDKARPLLIDHMVADWRDVVPRIQVPTLVMTGRHTPFYELDCMQWFADTVPDGRLRVFEHSGHDPYLNEYPEFNAQLLEFIAQH
jgi:non-heme chloroperoxidase